MALGSRLRRPQPGASPGDCVRRGSRSVAGKIAGPCGKSTSVRGWTRANDGSLHIGMWRVDLAERTCEAAPSVVGSVRSCTGRPYPPKSDREWFLRRGRLTPLVERESWLYFHKHGPVFHDPLGESTAHKRLFSHYPRDVRLKLTAGLCLGIWYNGEHKYCTRYTQLEGRCKRSCLLQRLPL